MLNPATRAGAMLRGFRDDLREFPATMTFLGLWVAVFAAMLYQQAARPPGLTFGPFVLGLHGGHAFGEMTLTDLFAGEIWRPLTATFVHYGLLHLGMNAFAMYQIGCWVESWYGPWLFAAIYVATGAGGNLLSALARHALGSDPAIASGGGSTVIMGLVALSAVVGWQARTPVGNALRDQMVWVLALTALIGLGLPLLGMPIIDNWGHAGGAVMGALIGLGNRGLARLEGGPAARRAGWASLVLVVAAGAAQWEDDRTEAGQRRVEAAQARQRTDALARAAIRLDEVRQVYRAVTAPRVIARGALVKQVPRSRRASGLAGSKASAGGVDAEEDLYRTVVNAAYRSLASMRSLLEAGSGAHEYRRVLVLADRSRTDPPSIEEFREFEQRMAALREGVARDLEFARFQATAGGQAPAPPPSE